MPYDNQPERPGRGKPVAPLTLLLDALRSKRTLSVSFLSFASGLPLGLVWYAIPDWMRDIGVDIRVVGLLTLAQAPWSLYIGNQATTWTVTAPVRKV